MMLKQTAFCLVIFITISATPTATFYPYYEKQTPIAKIEEKINNEKSKLKVDGALIVGGLTLWFLGTRNKNDVLTDTQLFSRFAGEVLAGVGTLLGVHSLQKLFSLNKRHKIQEEGDANRKAELEAAMNRVK